MFMQQNEFEQYLNELLVADTIKDYCPNGLQIQGQKNIAKIVTGVTASQALIDKAIAIQADTILVHHGYFWKNEPYAIRGIKHQRIKALLTHNINLFAYHLPVDVHPILGNNAQLGQLLTIDNIQALTGVSPEGIVMYGQLPKPVGADQFAQHITQRLNRDCLHIAPSSNKKIATVAWCTGGGQNYIELAAEHGIDAFITGEASEQTTHIAREMNIHFFAAGHHATERYGIKALGEHIHQALGLDVVFIDIDNPV
jgi:dinuclear metal center YbgI/SA1388 family protein